MATAKKTEDAKKGVKATPADLVAKVEASKKAAWEQVRVLQDL